MDAQTQEDRDIAEAMRLSMLESNLPRATANAKADLGTAVKLENGSPPRAGTSSNTGSLSVAEQLRDRAQRMKRERDLQDVSPPRPAKRPANPERYDAGPSRSSNIATFAESFGSSSFSSSSGKAHTLQFPDGALRITRTPGRMGQKNCISMEDLVSRDHLVSACLYSFFIAEPEFFPHFPFSKSSNAVPVR